MKLVLLVGSQGSGKTRYCSEKLQGYTRISQDDQGKDGHRKAFNEAIENGDEFIVVDRINHTRQQRGNYLQPAKKAGYNTRIVWLNIDRNTCIKRAKDRKMHPTLAPDKAEEAISWYFKNFQVPSRKEADELEIVGQAPYYLPVKDVTETIGNRRYIVVGDVHGCYDELIQMLDELNFDRQEDVLISTGDLIDRGPKIKEVIDFVMSLPHFYSVIGNHEDKCIRYFEGTNVKVANGLQKTIDAFDNKMPPEVLDFLCGMPMILKVPAGYVVHAGFDPLMLPEEQQRADCIYMRYYGGRSYFDAFDGILWYKLWPKENPTVFFGHIPEKSFPDLPNIKSLDGGCVFGDYLKAWDSKDGITYYVNAKETYCINSFEVAVTESASNAVAKREEYVVAGLLRKDMTDDGELVVYTYTDQCTFDGAWDEITRNSRGHVFNVKTGECVARPFSKFFNLGENGETLLEKFDWKQPYCVLEKVDGWLGCLVRHKGKFMVSSRGSFHSEGSQWATEFIQKFDLSCLPDEATLCFEIINPRQKIILDYKGLETLMILAAFNRHDGKEYPRAVVERWAEQIGLPIVRKFDMTIDDCIKTQKDVKDREGYVIVLADGRRVKVKTDWYLALAKIMSGMSPISIWETMAEGKVQESLLAQLPDDLIPLANRYKETLEHQYALVRERLEKDGRKVVEQFKGDRKQIGLHEAELGHGAFHAAFAILKNDQKKLNKMTMSVIYPAANEFVALRDEDAAAAALTAKR
jgi:RNA ligase